MHELYRYVESRVETQADESPSGPPAPDAQRSWFRTGAEPAMSFAASMRSPRDELDALLDELSPDDVDLLLEFARRLTR